LRGFEKVFVTLKPKNTERFLPLWEQAMHRKGNVMKKKLLVILPAAMEVGGVERSLIGLLGALDYERYEVDLFLYGHHGPLFDGIDPRVNLLPEVKELS
jgi:hypothetical protein